MKLNGRAHSGAPLHILLSLVLLSACVPVDQLPPGSLPAGAAAGATGSPTGGNAAAAKFEPLDPGNTEVTSLHFKLQGYNQTDLQPLSALAESLYNKIGNDTGLYSFLASGSYTLVVYRDQDEYIRKTHLPQWSRAVTVGNSIYLYPGMDTEAALAHEMTHLIFGSYMGDKTQNLRWINEGLAMYEELSKMTESDRLNFQTTQSTNLRTDKMPFSQMSFFTPLTEERRRVDTWYQQVESVVAYLLAQGGALNFAAMLNELRTGTDIDRAISDAYPGKFRALSDVEQAWKYTV